VQSHTSGALRHIGTATAINSFTFRESFCGS
jgi:hypothetical protein